MDALQIKMCSGVGVPGATKKARKASNMFALVPVPASAIRQPSSYSMSSSSNQRAAIPPPTRRAAPPINYKIRGVMPTTALGGNDREELLAELETDVNAPSTKEARDAKLRTWAWYHARWFGVDSEVLPLTTDSIKDVAAQMKHSGYRSFPTFLSAAKVSHLVHFAWSDELHRCGQDSGPGLRIRPPGEPRPAHLKGYDIYWNQKSITLNQIIPA